MRFQLQSDMNFLELLKQTHRWHCKTRSYQSCPYEEIVKKAGITEAHLREPLFNVYFSMENYSAIDLHLSGISSKKIDLTTGTSKFDLSLLILKEENKLHLSFEYPVSLQDRKFIERMAKNFQVFLKNLLASPKLEIGSLQLLAPKEKQELLKLGPGPKTGYPRDKSVVEIFERVAAKHPKNKAFRFLGETLRDFL